MTGALGAPPGETPPDRSAEGFSGILIYAAQGRERSDPREDINRWNGHGTRDGLNLRLYSWFTMTECVQRGIALRRDDTAFEVSPK